jgi:hypothetical protein
MEDGGKPGKPEKEHTKTERHLESLNSNEPTMETSATTKHVLTDVNNILVPPPAKKPRKAAARKPQKPKSLTKAQMNDICKSATKPELAKLYHIIFQEYPTETYEILNEYHPESEEDTDLYKDPPPTGELLKAANTMTKKKKVLTTAFKNSTLSQLVELLRQVAEALPALKQVDGLIGTFAPAMLPVKPASKDCPLLQQCFDCHTSMDLVEFHGVKVCNSCHPSHSKYGNMMRAQVMSQFYFTKKEADNIPRKETTGGFYKSTIYVYRVSSVVTAAKKKWGSLYSMMYKNTPEKYRY